MIDPETIRQHSDLPSIARSYGIHLRRAGAQLIAPCPFHREKSPSFFIHPGKQMFKCWGCGAEGDVFHFVQRMEALPGFRETARRVAELAGYPLTDEPWTPEQKQEYARKREYARRVAGEAEMFWLLVRLRISTFINRIYGLDRQLCRWALKQQDAEGTTPDPRIELAWLIWSELVPFAESLEQRMWYLDEAQPEVLMSLYLERRTPALVTALRRYEQEAKQDTAIFVAMLTKSVERN